MLHDNGYLSLWPTWRKTLSISFMQTSLYSDYCVEVIYICDKYLKSSNNELADEYL